MDHAIGAGHGTSARPTPQSKSWAMPPTTALAVESRPPASCFVGTVASLAPTLTASSDLRSHQNGRSGRSRMPSGMRRLWSRRLRPRLGWWLRKIHAGGEDDRTTGTALP